MPVQSSNDYKAIHGAGFEGQIVDLQLKNITSKVVEVSTGIPFGRAVVRGTGDNGIVLPSSATDAFIGLSVMTTDGVESVDGVHQYEYQREANVLDVGIMYLYTETSVVPGDPVFFRYTAKTAPLDIVGRVRKDADTASAKQIIGATFESTGVAGDLVKVKITGQN
jgi:hypothetical protein